jgi:predicted transcriptional regulator of viral defense system
MRYDDFRRKYTKWPVVPASYVIKDSGEDPQAVRNQLSRWAKKGFILSLRKGLYSFRPEDSGAKTDILYLANRLYEPSYVSLEFALSLYEIIPEYVPVVTSVTTRKTLTVKNPSGHFSYQHVTPNAFRGFRQKKMEGESAVLMAEPEKAVLDFLYLNMRQFGKDLESVLADSYRFQNLDSLDPKRIDELARCFNSPKLSRLANQLTELVTRQKT